jgi:hypothetical protein
MPSARTLAVRQPQLRNLNSSSYPARFPDSVTPPRYCSASPALHLFAAFTGLPPRVEPAGSALGGLGRGLACPPGPAREAHLENRATKPDREAHPRLKP